MSFNEFMQWLRNLFSSRTETPSQPDGPNDNPTVDTPTTPGVTPPIDATPGDSPEDPFTPASTPEIVEPDEEEIITPPVLAPQPTLIQRIDTGDAKVALDKTVSFQIVTEPAGDYSDCSLDLSEADNASIVEPINSNTGQFSLSFNKASDSDNDTQTVTVKNPQGDASSVVTVSLMKLFWSHHPGRKNVCDETLFANQCAIRMSTALELSGIKLPEDRRILRRCTTEYRAFKHHKDGLVKGHVLAAQELANWMKSERSIFGRRSVVHSREEIEGRSGLIFFRDGWGSTDHIDVWDGESLVGGFPSYFESDFKELWFWDVY